jgi:peptidoglycan/LPS O-acetylase OafA/YrhL
MVLWGAAFQGSFQTRILRSWPLRISGDLSYCLYLVHCMVMDAYDAVPLMLSDAPVVAGFRGILIRAAVVVPVTFIIAAVSRVILEKPALRLKRFFEAPQNAVKELAASTG